MANKKFEAELATLDTLRQLSPAGAEAPLRQALANKNNYLAAKAAKITAEHNLQSLTPELAAAFHRFLQDPIKTDPQCWAKNALAETLARFDYQEPDLFLAGLRHLQLEASWGGTTDTAGPLRSTCALALVQCRTLSSHTVLHHLTPLFADKELNVQVNTARAVEQLGNDSSALLLKLRAELGSGDP